MASVTKSLHSKTKESLISLPTKTLRAIVSSTAPDGKYWLQRVWAVDELARRERTSWEE